MGYVVYMHMTPNGKKYIGITKQDLSARWKNGEGYKKCPAFYRAIMKYGWDNINHEIIDECETFEEANELEKSYISKYKTNQKEYGYNCTIGGDGVTGWKASEEQRSKNSKSKIEMWKDEDIRSRLIEERRTRGKNDEEKKRLKEYVIQNWNNPEMSENLKKHLREIANDPICKAKRSARMKKLWAEHPEIYASNLKRLKSRLNDPLIREKQSKMMKQLWAECPEKFIGNGRKWLCGEDNPAAKSVRCIETGKVYCTAREAEADTGISYKSISDVFRKRRKTSHGLHWEYVEKV